MFRLVLDLGVSWLRPVSKHLIVQHETAGVDLIKVIPAWEVKDFPASSTGWTKGLTTHSFCVVPLNLDLYIFFPPCLYSYHRGNLPTCKFPEPSHMLPQTDSYQCHIGRAHQEGIWKQCHSLVGVLNFETVLTIATSRWVHPRNSILSPAGKTSSWQPRSYRTEQGSQQFATQNQAKCGVPEQNKTKLPVVGMSIELAKCTVHKLVSWIAKVTWHSRLTF